MSSVRSIFFHSFKSLRTKLILAFLVPIVFIILLGIISYNTATKSIENETKQFALQAIRSSSQYISSVNIDPVKLSCSTLFRDPVTSTVLGVLVIDLRTDNLRDIITNIKIGKNSEIHLISPDGYDFGTLSTMKGKNS